MPERNIVVEEINVQPVETHYIELVERKGLGHPDYIADAASEASSIALSKYYKKRYGVILHHNLDKTLVVGGQSSPRFGGGEVIQPIYILISGRATTTVYTSGSSEPERIPIGTLIIEAVREWIKRNFRFLDPDKHVIIDYKIGQGSRDLRGLFETGIEKTPLANDTSFGSGYAPMSRLERAVLMTERYINSREFKNRYPEIGEDVKVMGLRIGNKAKITVASSMISHLIPDLQHYLSIKEEVKDRITDYLVKNVEFDEIEVYLNTADIPEKGIVYLTVTGTSAEHGDDGMTGRGNRANGLITPMRFMSLEATAGKNPVSHVGKIYNVLAFMIAEKIYNEVKGIREVYVELLSQIGRPIDQPLMAGVKVVPEQGYHLSDNIKSEIRSIVDEELANITRLTDLFVEGKLTLF
ncbi:MAG: methionine adenosyltransferase [Desulfurococcales archaeon]|jgi:S-adenosylmethionine synthetase|nr:methionine adenosyltransferase [Desulfurococcales archaeon]